MSTRKNSSSPNAKPSSPSGGIPRRRASIIGGPVNNKQKQNSITTALPELPTKAAIDTLPQLIKEPIKNDLHEKGTGRSFTVSDLTAIQRIAQSPPKSTLEIIYGRLDRRKSISTNPANIMAAVTKNLNKNMAITRSVEDRIQTLMDRGPLDEESSNLIQVLESAYNSRQNSPNERKLAYTPGTLPKILSEQRLSQAQQEYTESIAETQEAARKVAEEHIHEFKSEWMNHSRDFSQIYEALASDQFLSSITRAEFENFIFKEKALYEACIHNINVLEKHLEENENKRINVIGSALIDFGRKVHQIKFDNPSLVVRMIQEEAAAMNLDSIKHREDILRYTSAFLFINEERHEANRLYFEKVELSWKKLRYEHLFDCYRQAIEKISSKDVNMLYQKYQTLFDELTVKQTSQIHSLLQQPFDQITKDSIANWESICKSVYTEYQNCISGYKSEISAFDGNLESEAKTIMDEFLPQLGECNYLDDIQLVNNLSGRKMVFQAEKRILGKRSAVTLQSQLNRNHDVLLLVVDVIQCLIIMREDANKNIGAIELDTQTRLNSCHNTTLDYYRRVEEFLAQEMTEMAKDEEEKILTNRTAKCTDKLKAVEEAQKAFNNVEQGVVDSLFDNILRSLEIYRAKVYTFFGVNVADPTVPTPTENELEFLAKKILEFYNFNNQNSDNKGTKGKRNKGENNGISAFQSALAAIAARREITNDSNLVESQVNSTRKKEALKDDNTTHIESEILKKDLSIVEALRNSIINLPNSARPENQIQGVNGIGVAKTITNNAPFIRRASTALINLGVRLEMQNINDSEMPVVNELESYSEKSDNQVSLLDKKDDAVTLKPIPQEALATFRVTLHHLLLEHLNTFQAEKISKVQSRTMERKSTLRDESSTALFTMEVWQRKVEQTSKLHLDRIKNLKDSLEVQVRMIEHRIESIQQNFLSMVEQNESVASQFVELVNSNLVVRITENKTTNSLKKLQADVEMLREKYLAALQTALNTANEKFQQEMDMLQLYKSKSDPWHPQSWELVLQKMNAAISSLVGPMSHVGDPLLSVYKWKENLYDRIRSYENSINDAVSKGLDDLQAHLQDIKVLEESNQKVQSFRLKVKAEDFLALNTLENVEKSIENLVAERDTRKLEWNRVIGLVSALENIRKSVSDFAFYLECVKSGREKFILEVKLFDYESWKSGEINFLNNRSKKEKSKSQRSLSSASKMGSKLVVSNEALARLDKIARYISVVNNSRDDSRNGVMVLAEGYFKDKDPSTIRRFTEIPETFPLFLNKIDCQLDKIESNAENSRRKWIDRLLKCQQSALHELTVTFKKIMVFILHSKFNDLETCWRDRTAWYTEQIHILRQARNELDKLLKARMGHPLFAEELTDLDVTAKEREAKLKDIVRELENTVLFDIGALSLEFVQKIDYCTCLFAQVLNSFLMHTDIERPVDAEDGQRRMMKDLLQERKRQKEKKEEITDGSSRSPVKAKSLTSIKDVCESKDEVTASKAKLIAFSDKEKSTANAVSSMPKKSALSSRSSSRPSSSRPMSSRPGSSRPDSAKNSEAEYEEQYMSLKALDVDLLPVKTHQNVDIRSVDIECRKTHFHEQLGQFREEIMRQFSKEVCRRHSHLLDQLQTDKQMEYEWKICWVDSLNKIRKIYQ